jgi:hypothetical protein
LKNLGFTNLNEVIDALIKSGGQIEKTIEILCEK